MPGAAALSLIHLCNCPLTVPHLPGPDVLSLGDTSVLNCPGPGGRCPLTASLWSLFYLCESEFLWPDMIMVGAARCFDGSLYEGNIDFYEALLASCLPPMDLRSVLWLL